MTSLGPRALPLVRQRTAAAARLLPGSCPASAPAAVRSGGWDRCRDALPQTA